MDIATSAADFTTFLLECASKNPAKGGRFTYEITVGEKTVQVSANLLPPLVRSPLSEITGPLQSPTVLLASTERLTDEEEGDSPELDAILDRYSDSVLEQQHVREGREGADARSLSPNETVRLVEQETVFVGQRLSRKRRYLGWEVDVHPGQSSTIITQVDPSGVVPLSLDLARTLVSFYLVGSREEGSVSLPALWIPCKQSTARESASREDIVGFGCTFEQKDARCSRVLCVRDKGERGGEGTKKKKQRDFKKLTEFKGNSAFARYEIMSSGTHSSVGGPRIAVEFSWDDPDTLLAPPPSVGCEAVLQVAVEPGSLPSTAAMLTELQTLLRVCESVQNRGSYFTEVEEEEEESVLGNRKREPLLVNGVGDFLERVDTPLSHSLQVSVVSPSVESTVCKPRENLDFTESLWVFVRDVQTAEDLQATLGAIFKSVLLGKVRNISVRGSSNSSLALLLRELVKSRSASERQTLAPKFQLLLTTARSLHTLAQIGIEKLKRDMKGFLVGSRILSDGEFEEFFEAREGMTGQCYSLCNLYHVLELLATLVNHHAFPSPTLTALARSAAEFYKHRHPFRGFEKTPLFAVPFSRNSTVLRPIIDMCVSTPPTLWCACSKGGDRMSIMSTVGLDGKTSTMRHFYEVTCREV